MKTPVFIKSGSSFLVYSNIFLAFCATAYTAKTALLLTGTNGNWHVNSIVFFATLFLYCFHRINKRKLISPNELIEERNDWVNNHKTLYLFLIGISTLMLLEELFFMPLRTWLVFIPVGALGLGYTFPIIPTTKGWKRLRDIYWLKTFWIAFAFSWLTTFLPAVYRGSLSSMLKPEVLFIFIRGLLFLFAICIPFDIRDIEFDKQKGVTTLPVLFGAKNSVYIAVILLLLFIFLVGTDFVYFNLNIKAASALSLSAMVTVILLQFAKAKRNSLVFPLLYDGAMLTQWIFLFVFMLL